MAFILDNLFDGCMRKVDPFDTVSDADICMAISNANGHQPCLFVPEISFHQLVKRQIWRLERPALETVEAVNLEMLVSSVRLRWLARLACQDGFFVSTC